MFDVTKIDTFIEKYYEFVHILLICYIHKHILLLQRSDLTIESRVSLSPF